MRHPSHRLFAFAAAMLAFASTCVQADSGNPAQSESANAVAGEKLDSGLGELPPYALWTDKSGRNPTAVVGEKLDSGLGDLPAYHAWSDKMKRNSADAAPAMVQGEPTRTAQASER